MKRGWRTVADVAVRRREWPRESDEWIWHHYSLMLLINRHCPECFDDDTVSSALQTARQNIKLPFEDVTP